MASSTQVCFTISSTTEGIYTQTSTSDSSNRYRLYRKNGTTLIGTVEYNSFSSRWDFYNTVYSTQCTLNQVSINPVPIFPTTWTCIPGRTLNILDSTLGPCGPSTSQTPTPTQTPTTTVTPTTTSIVCGNGITQNSFYYTDCCGNVVQGTGANQNVVLDYRKPSNGIIRLNTSATQSCPSKTPTPTQTTTPTNTPTSKETPTPTPTATITPSPTGKELPPQFFVQKNECEVFTLFDMGIQCNVIKSPTTNTSFDGILSVNVTGGTSPYNFYWDDGLTVRNTQVITGIKEGLYPITVRDYYGDYTLSTICSISGPPLPPQPSQTPTPTSTPEPILPKLCFNCFTQSLNIGQLNFTYNGYENGKPRWVSGSKTLVWVPSKQRWEILGWTESTGLPVSTSQSDIPLSSWSIQGYPGQQPQIVIYQGDCLPYLPLNTTIQTNNTLCNNNVNCNGSIIVSASFGQPPYSYSINNFPYQSGSIFNGLCAGQYTVNTKDSANNIQSKIVTIGSNNNNVSYVLNVESVGQVAYSKYVTAFVEGWRVTVTPALPLGTSISFLLTVNNVQQVKGPGTADLTGIIEVKSGNVILTPLNTQIGTTVTPRENCSPAQTTATTKVETYQVTITNTNSVSGTTFTDFNVLSLSDGTEQPDDFCQIEMVQTITISTINPVVNGCLCCVVVNDTTPLIITYDIPYGKYAEAVGITGGSGGAVP